MVKFTHNSLPPTQEATQEMPVEKSSIDYSSTLFLPKTDFPMRACLAKTELELLTYWEQMNLYGKLREKGQGRPQFILHDGPPYANGHIHIGHAMNKILKDMIAKSQFFCGKTYHYLPGWDCHGLPIECKVEENYRAHGRQKEEVPIGEFRQQCRTFAEKWLDIQRKEFKRLGILGSWERAYNTMDFYAEAQIAREFFKFVRNGTVYQGSKPVLWSVVEKTALAEAEVEYHDHVSDAVYVAFPVGQIYPQASLSDQYKGETIHLLIWTTTPWTLPANRALAYSAKLTYGLYRCETIQDTSSGGCGGKIFALADVLAEASFQKIGVHTERLQDFNPQDIAFCYHPLKDLAYDFPIPLLESDHVTGDMGTGFVHTAPGHGLEDFDLWMKNRTLLAARNIDIRIPEMVDAEGYYTKEAPYFVGKSVITPSGNKGNANENVMAALRERGYLIAAHNLKHSYPHSWRSKKPLIFRNTPQWFIGMDTPIQAKGGSAGVGEETLRQRALKAIDQTEWLPESSKNRITGMISRKPDWVISRQRSWGVPLSLFVHRETREILKDERVNQRILSTFLREGADSWFADKTGSRFLSPEFQPEDYEKINDILDVWFDSGCTHAFVLEAENLLIKRKKDGGPDEIMCIEGSDQHRGWFQSSLIESCGTRNCAPYDRVITHGFILEEQTKNKMSKSTGQALSPKSVTEKFGADVLRLWVASSEVSGDIHFGPHILTSFSESYRKLRNTLRWMLGCLTHFDPSEPVIFEDLPELERFILHRLAQTHELIGEAQKKCDYQKIMNVLSQFLNGDLSAFYFDIRKDALYCDPLSSKIRHASLTTLDILLEHILIWLAPILSFTSEEAWLVYCKTKKLTPNSVFLTTPPVVPKVFFNEALNEKWRLVRRIRSLVTGALEIERQHKRIGSSLEAAPIVYLPSEEWLAILNTIDFAEICITSGISLRHAEGPSDAFRHADTPGVSIVPTKAEGQKCARSWKFSTSVGADPEFPYVSLRDAQALRELRQQGLYS